MSPMLATLSGEVWCGVVLRRQDVATTKFVFVPLKAWNANEGLNPFPLFLRSWGLEKFGLHDFGMGLDRV